MSLPPGYKTSFPELVASDAAATSRDSATNSTNSTPEDNAARFTLTVRTARELLGLPEPPEGDLLLGPLIVRGGRTIIVGDTGHGKTTLAAQMVAAVLTGADVLGYTGAGLGPVLVLDLEQGVRSIKRTLRDTGLDAREDVLHVSAPDGLSLDSDEEHRSEVERIVAEHRPAVIVLDPFYKAHRGDANEERAVVDLMRYLDRLRTEHGFALVLPAHPRKDPSSSGARKLTLHDVAGSGAITRGAEIVLALERLSHGYARLRFLKDRDFDLPIGDAWPLVFARGEGFKLDPKEERATEDLERRILADPEWRTLNEWATVLGVRKAKARELLDVLTETGKVEYAEGPPGRNASAKCWRGGPERGTTADHQSKKDGPQAGGPGGPASIGTPDTGPPADLGNEENENGTTGTTSHLIAGLDEAEVERLAALARETVAARKT
jgi:KaiC/GvpD/RAD55 family RecA-like ATPase